MHRKLSFLPFTELVRLVLPVISAAISPGRLRILKRSLLFFIVSSSRHSMVFLRISSCQLTNPQVRTNTTGEKALLPYKPFFFFKPSLLILVIFLSVFKITTTCFTECHLSNRKASFPHGPKLYWRTEHVAGPQIDQKVIFLFTAGGMKRVTFRVMVEARENGGNQWWEEPSSNWIPKFVWLRISGGLTKPHIDWGVRVGKKSILKWMLIS